LIRLSSCCMRFARISHSELRVGPRIISDPMPEPRPAPAKPETAGPAMQGGKEVNSSGEDEMRDAESVLDLRLQVAVLEAEIMQLREEKREMRSQTQPLQAQAVLEAEIMQLRENNREMQREAERLQAQALQLEQENWMLVRHMRMRESKMYCFLRKMAVRLQIDKTVIVPN